MLFRSVVRVPTGTLPWVLLLRSSLSSCAGREETTREVAAAPAAVAAQHALALALEVLPTRTGAEEVDGGKNEAADTQGRQRDSAAFVVTKYVTIT